MLQPDVAAKRLKEMKAPDWVDARLASIAGQPEKVRTTVRSLFGRDAAGKAMPYDKKYAAKQKAEEQFVKMSAAERAAAFKTIFGDLAPYVTAGWAAFHRLPYHSTYARKPFRLPSGGAALDKRRASWVASIASTLEGYAGHQNIEWVAAWAPHLEGYGANDLGLLLAAAIDAGGQTGDHVLEILKDSASNQHDIGQMGGHVTRALMSCANPDAWSFIERLLLAAQRQEGLRQTILETIDEAHPAAFRRMVRLILDENLARFSATVRAVDVWFGLRWDAVSTKVVVNTLEKTLTYLDDTAARQKAIDGSDAEQTYLALWAAAFDDAKQAIPLAAGLLKEKRVEKRFVAVHLLNQIRLDESRSAAIAALEDPGRSSGPGGSRS